MQEKKNMAEQVQEPAAENENEAASLNVNNLEDENAELRAQLDKLKKDLSREIAEREKFRDWWLEDSDKAKRLKKTLLAVVRAKDMSAEELVNIVFG